MPPHSEDVKSLPKKQSTFCITFVITIFDNLSYAVLMIVKPLTSCLWPGLSMSNCYDGLSFLYLYVARPLHIENRLCWRRVFPLVLRKSIVGMRVPFSKGSEGSDLEG